MKFVRKYRHSMAASAWLYLLVLVLLSSRTEGQPVEQNNSTRTTKGTVKELSDEWIMVKPPEGLALRYWFKWIGASNSAPDKAVQSAVAKIKSGDDIEVRWSFDDRERVESLVLVSATLSQETHPEPAKETTPATTPQTSTNTRSGGPTSTPATNAPPVKPASAASHTASPDAKSAAAFNNLIDNLMAASGRALDLPFFMLLTAIGMAGLVMALAIRSYSRKAGAGRLTRTLLIAESALGLFAVALVVDRKIARLQTAVTELRSKTSADSAALLSVVSKLQAKRQSFLVSPTEVQKILSEKFGEVTAQPMIYDEATDFVRIQIKRPLTQVFVAVVDLRNPAVEIRLGVTLDKKRLTSVFARENDCSLAINGEAGMSPALNSGLGDWRGNLVWQGQVLLRETAKYQAPFLSFDRKNHADFTPATSTNRTLGPDLYNAIWGRWDVLVNGVVPTGDSATRQPRTAMAISQDGARLCLLVADGRQTGYSMGLTLSGVGQCLQAFGAYNGMACDEGGSSCIYLKQFGGIVNIPADNSGQERPTYTHFGIKMREGE